jgi:hypothetical protein
VHGEEVLGVRLGGAHLVGNLSSHSEVHFVVWGTYDGDRAWVQFLSKSQRKEDAYSVRGYSSYEKVYWFVVCFFVFCLFVTLFSFR